jgi:hypothetical protein
VTSSAKRRAAPPGAVAGPAAPVAEPAARAGRAARLPAGGDTAAEVAAGGSVGGGGRDPVLLRVAAGVLVTVLAAALAVVESFLVPLRIGSVPFPLCIALALAGNAVLARLAGAWTGSVLGSAAPPVVWLLVVIVLSMPRPEGDLIVPGTLTGLLFLFAGAVAGAYGVASSITRRVRAVT